MAAVAMGGEGMGVAVEARVVEVKVVARVAVGVVRSEGVGGER